MDCSGFARTLYERLFRIELPHNSRKLYQLSDLRQISSPGLQSGDLIFFADKRRKRINHVGIYLSNGEFIHASSSQGIMVSKLDGSYWKRRYVGSKRHLALNSGSRVKKAGFENFLEIPVHRNGTINGRVQHELRSETAGLLDDGADSFRDTLYDLPEEDHSYLNSYQIGYNRAIVDGLDVNFSAFQDKYDTSDAWPGLDPFSRIGGYWQGTLSSDTAVRRGFTMASAIRPSNWLSLTPSITWFEDSLELRDDWEASKRTFGLNSLFTPSHGRWSLAMLFQYSDPQDFVSFGAVDQMFNSLDMAVRLGFNLSERLQFSVTGKHDKHNNAYDNADNAASSRHSTSDVFFSFDLSY